MADSSGVVEAECKVAVGRPVNGVGPEGPVEPAPASMAADEEGEEEDKGGDQQPAFNSLWLANESVAKLKPETPVLLVTKGLLDSKTFRIQSRNRVDRIGKVGHQ